MESHFGDVDVHIAIGSQVDSTVDQIQSKSSKLLQYISLPHFGIGNTEGITEKQLNSDQVYNDHKAVLSDY